MSRTHRPVKGNQKKGQWLVRADAIKGKAPGPTVYRHAKSPTASPERVRELAGIIELDRPAPSKKFIRSCS